MPGLPTLKSEAMKLASLPATWLASGMAVLIPPLLAFANGNTLHRALSTGNRSGLTSLGTENEGFGQLTFGVVGVVVLGVIAISSEYARNEQAIGGARQVSTTMAAEPARIRVMAAKLGVLVVWVVALSAVSIPLTLWVSRTVLGGYATDFGTSLFFRMAGAALYWVVMVLLSFSLAAVSRNGVLPLVLLLTNASVVSFSLLIAQTTDLAKYLPDIAAYTTFVTESPAREPLDARTGALVCLAWGVAASTLAIAAYVRRDA